MQTAQGQAGPEGRLPVIELGNWGWFGVKNGTLQPSIGSTGEIDLKPNVGFTEVPSVTLPHTAYGGVTVTPRLEPAAARRLTGPVQFILKLLEFWRLEEGDAIGLLGFDQSDADHVAQVLGGSKQFRGRDVKDRIGQLYSIRKSLWSLFQDLDAENGWLRESQPLLDGKTPLALLSGSMEDLLWLRDYVDEMAGR